MTPAALRAMRGAMDWSLRDAAEQTGVAINTLRTIEEGGSVTEKIRRRVIAAFRRHGVRVAFTAEGQATVIIGAPMAKTKQALPQELLGLPFLALRERKDGTYRVLFEVKPRDRPMGWPATRPLPSTHPRRGDLTDPMEVRAIRDDAKRLAVELDRARRLPTGKIDDRPQETAAEPQRRLSRHRNPKATCEASTAS